jgi:hypothetical protein
VEEYLPRVFKCSIGILRGSEVFLAWWGIIMVVEGM